MKKEREEEEEEEEGDRERKGENPRDAVNTHTDAATTHADGGEFIFCFSFSLS